MGVGAKGGGAVPNDQTKRSNRLLDALPEDEYQRLAGKIERRTMSLKHVLHGAGARITEVHFPVDAVVSVLTQMDDGPSVEIATVGNEGLVGLTVSLGGDTMNPRERAVVQVGGDVFSMEAGAFREEMARGGALTSLIQRYTQAFLSQVTQQVACNGLHSVEQRCARWLLLTHDRVGVDEFPMTHEFLAQMLGVRRASVTVTVGVFQRAGFIELRRGRLTITDREGLEETACECYSATREVWNRLLP
ncbi:MAG: Crp/Fnr family transcriptional regulator [Actinobacteria bacterium]|nr:MAG: Crp/Fnr family transcriptional regulator [Actinomycetota bacterium]